MRFLFSLIWCLLGEVIVAQFENLVENNNYRNRQARKPKPQAKKGKAKLGLAAQEILDGSDRYNMWWTGPPQMNDFVPVSWSKQHTAGGNAIFSFAIQRGPDPLICDGPACGLHLFLGSARRSGFTGDIVVAIEANPLEEVKTALVKHGAIVYELQSDLCSKAAAGFFCGSEEERVPVSVFRYYVYEKWLAAYAPEALVLLADYRDVVFQSNPFTYRTHEWRDYNLQVFLNFHPNMLMARSREYRNLLMGCYGPEVVRLRGSMVAVSAGAMLGSRDGMLFWTRQMTQQLQDAPGRLQETRCSGPGIDKAFVNFLVYNNKVRNTCRTKLYPQGEGSVNSLEGMHPGYPGANITGSIKSFWHMLGDDGFVRNWNGDIAPVVHQMHHFRDEFGAADDKNAMWQSLASTKCLIGCAP